MTFLVCRKGRALNTTNLDRFSVIDTGRRFEVVAVFKRPLPGFDYKAYVISYKVMRWFREEGVAKLYCNALKASMGWKI